MPSHSGPVPHSAHSFGTPTSSSARRSGTVRVRRLPSCLTRMSSGGLSGVVPGLPRWWACPGSGPSRGSPRRPNDEGGRAECRSTVSGVLRCRGMPRRVGVRKCDVSMPYALILRLMCVWCPPTTSSPRRRSTSHMFVDAATASRRISGVHFTPSRWKWEVSTPSRFMRVSTYRRVELLGSTPAAPVPPTASVLPGRLPPAVPSCTRSPPPIPSVVRPRVRGLVRSNEPDIGRSRTESGTACTGTPVQAVPKEEPGQMPRSLMILATWPVARTL